MIQDQHHCNGPFGIWQAAFFAARKPWQSYIESSSHNRSSCKIGKVDKDVFGAENLSLLLRLGGFQKIEKF